MQFSSNRTRYILAILLLSLALMLNQGELYVILGIGLLIYDSVFLIPLLIYFPIVGSALDEFSIIPTELFFAALMFPFLILNIKTIVIGKYKLLFIYIFMIVVLGFVVAIMNSDSDSQRNTIYRSNLIVCIKVLYYYLLFLYLSAKPLLFYVRTLQVFKAQFPLFILSLFIYVSLFGKVYGEGYVSEYVNFGIGTHGYYGAMLALISPVFFYNILISKKVLSIISSLLILLLTLYLIVISGSRNGFLSLIFVNFLTYLAVVGMKNVKGVFVFIAIFLVLFAFIINLENNPILNRTADLESKDVSSGRFDLWTGALNGFLENPLTGIGNNTTFLMNYLEGMSGVRNVTHSTLIEFGLIYGINGFILFFAIVYITLRGFYFAKLNYKNKIISKELYLPYLMTFSVIFSSFFISWTWDSIVWYPFIIALSLTISLKINLFNAYS